MSPLNIRIVNVLDEYSILYSIIPNFSKSGTKWGGQFLFSLIIKWEIMYYIKKIRSHRKYFFKQEDFQKKSSFPELGFDYVINHPRLSLGLTVCVTNHMVL